MQAEQPVEECEIPSLLLWDWFWELDAARGSNGFGLNPISYEAIQAWSAMTGAAPEPWEVSTLKAMDMGLLSERAKEK